MDSFILAMVAACVGISLGSWGGYAAGRATEAHAQHNRRMAALNGGPRYSRGSTSNRHP